MDNWLNTEFEVTGIPMSRMMDYPEIRDWVSNRPALKELLGYGLVRGIMFTIPIRIRLARSQQHQHLIDRAIKEVDAVFEY